MSFVIIVIGASGIIAQIVLIRELLVIFQGNELSIGIILANWLVAEALGSYLFRKARISQKSYQSLIFGFALFFPMFCTITKLLRPILKVIPGEIISIPVMFVSSLVILLPVSFLHGASFTATVSFLSTQHQPELNKIPGKVYVLENIGTAIGGVIISFLLIPYLTSLQIAFIISLINLLALLILIRTKHPIMNLIKFTFLILLGILLFYTNKIEQWAVKKNYPKYEVISSNNTIYSNITVIKREEQFTYLVDGTPTIITPYPDQFFIEDFVNFPLLMHNNPKRILLISGGAGGVLSQMLKYPIQQIDYLELDPWLIKSIQDNPTNLTSEELTDPRVKVINTDARFFINREVNKYDVILVSFLTPLSLQTNRFFTKEFYSVCQEKLNPGGILVTLTPGSLTYISPNLRNLVNSHLKTLNQVFPNVFIIPGDFNLYFSSLNQLDSSLCPDSLLKKLNQNRITTKVFSLNYIKYRIQKDKQDWLYKSLETNQGNINNATKNIKKLINYDGKPLGLFYNLWYGNTIANPSLNNLFVLISAINLYPVVIILLLVFVVLILLKKKIYRFSYLPCAIFSTGMVAMIFSLVISLGFQIHYGYLYYQISILLTTFIAGTTIGGYFGNVHIPNKRNYFLLIELMIIILLVLLVTTLTNRAYPKIFGCEVDFFIFLFSAGLLVGFEFPIANKIYNITNPQLAVGKLYAADLLGGFVGAIIVSVILIPVLGIFQTLIFATALKTMSALLILTDTRF